VKRACRFGFDFDQTIADSSPGISQCLDVVAKDFNSRIKSGDVGVIESKLNLAIS
jgi:hypothetical protein